MEEDGADKQSVPTFFPLLNPKDQADYETLRESLHSKKNKFKRNKRLTSLQNALNFIHKYVVRKDGDDWKRSLVCGVCWMPFSNDIAINTSQLSLLIDKCKSSINGALSKMGYGPIVMKGEGSVQLLTAIPNLKGNFVEQRRWSVRKRLSICSISGSPAPNMIATPQYLPSTSQFVTPQPRPAVTFFDNADELAALFGEPIKRQTPIVHNNCQLANDVNFFSDACCCCPIDWQPPNDEFLEYG